MGDPHEIPLSLVIVQTMKEVKRSLPIAIGSIIVAIVIGEAVLRGIGMPHKLDSGWGWENSPGRKPSKFSDLTTNQLGLRGQTISYHTDDYVVLLVGDSGIEASAGPPEHMPEQFLQKSLAIRLKKPVKVFSLASSGWGQDQQLLTVQEYFRAYRADLVLLWPTLGNDFWENAFPDRSVTPEAGHLKPTFRLIDQELHGPYLSSGSYLHHSAILQLAESVMAKINKEPLEQRILRSWLIQMPAPHENKKQANESLCEGLIVIDQREFYRTIFELNPNIGYTVKSGEDFLSSRSMFSPYMSDLSKRDVYLIKITEHLLRRIKAEVEDHHAKFIVFHARREEFDKRGTQMVKCVSDAQGKTFGVSFDYEGLLKRIVSSSDLIVFDLPGGNENVVSPEDRHLNNFGNMQAMEILSSSLMERAVFDR